MYLPNLTSLALPVLEIIAIEVWGGVKPNLGEGVDVEGWGWYRSKGGFMTFYRHSIVTFPLSLSVSEILPFLCASAPIFSHPTSSLPKISPCSPRSRWIAFGVQRAKVFG